MYRNRKKLVSFIKAHTKKSKYDNLSDLELNSKIREFQSTNEYYLNIETPYKIFLEKYDKLSQICSEAQKDLNDFYQKNLVRKTLEGKALFFIKYPIYDIYFVEDEIENEFFKKYSNVIKLFIERLELFNNLSLNHYNYLFPNEHKDYIKFKSENSLLRQINFLTTDIINLTSDGLHFLGVSEHQINPNKKGEIVQRDTHVMVSNGKGTTACTFRTEKLFKKILEVIKNKQISTIGRLINGAWIEIPNIPELSYVKWYFQKLIDANNQEIRKIDLVLRSRKRSIELADNSYFVYVMSNQAYSNIYKIGWTSSLPEERAEELTGTGHLHPFKVEYSKKFKNAEKVERQCHEYFKKNRVANNREFFEVPLNEIKDYIDSIK